MLARSYTAETLLLYKVLELLQLSQGTGEVQFLERLNNWIAEEEVREGLQDASQPFMDYNGSFRFC